MISRGSARSSNSGSQTADRTAAVTPGPRRCAGPARPRSRPSAPAAGRARPRRGRPASAPGTARARASPWGSGKTGSSSPWTTRVGSGDVAEAAALRPVHLDQIGVGQGGRHVGGPGDVRLDQRPGGGLVEERRHPVVRAEHPEDVLDLDGRVTEVGGLVRPVAADRGQPGLAGARADERDARDPIRVVHPEEQREGAEHRATDDVGLLHPESVEDGERVVGQVGEVVGRRPDRIGGGPAGVALVVADDEAARSREPFAQPGLPPEHGGGRPVDQQDGRIVAPAEGLHAEPYAVHVQELFGHVVDARTRRRSGKAIISDGDDRLVR